MTTPTVTEIRRNGNPRRRARRTRTLRGARRRAHPVRPGRQRRESDGRPLAPGGRAYLVERGLEEEGANANAALHALIEDHLRQASILDEIPMAAVPF
jgi:hypothetical protein